VSLLIPRKKVNTVATLRREMLKTWSKDPYAFLTADDTDGRPIYWTKDEGDEDDPYKPFPKDWAFQKRLLDDLFSEEKIALADKSRQMMVSTICCGAGLWLTMFRRGRKFMISKQKEDQSWMLIQDKIIGPYERLPKWLRDLFPFEIKKNLLRCTTTDSMILGVGQNAAASEFRGNQASILMIDEAAFQEYFPDMLRAAKPMAAKVWAVTTANTGNPGAEKFDKMRREP
jgi:hypothetical protein